MNKLETPNADTVFRLAEKRIGDRLEKTHWYDRFFTSEEDIEECSELFVRAGNLYNAHSQHERAENAFIKSAQCLVKLNKIAESANSLVLAANSIKTTFPERSAEYYCTAVDRVLDSGRLYNPVNWLMNAGDIYNDLAKNDLALQCYQRALELSSADNNVMNKEKCSIKLADILANNKKYIEAHQMYESIAKSFSEDLIKRYKAPYYFFMACLCFGCNDDLVGFQNKISEYSSIMTTSSRDTYFKFLEKIIIAWQNYDVDEFTQVTAEFDDISKLTPLQVSLLLKIKNYVSGEVALC